MKARYRGRPRAGTRGTPFAAGISLLLAAVLALGACARQSTPTPLAFPARPSGGIEIRYPLDQTLFPPEIVAPTFVWSDKTEGVKTWTVLVRFDDKGEVLRFPTAEPRWRPSEADWASFKQRSVDRDAEVAIVGVGPDAAAASSATVRIRTSRDPVGDSIFYREVPLPFISAVQDPRADPLAVRVDRLRNRTAHRAGGPACLRELPLVLGRRQRAGPRHVDSGNDKGAYAILTVSQQMTLNDEKIITWNDYKQGRRRGHLRAALQGFA